MRIGFFIVFFLLFCAFFLVSQEGLHLSSSQEAHAFGKLYYNWFINLTKSGFGVIGYVIKADWLPDNASESVNFSSG